MPAVPAFTLDARGGLPRRAIVFLPVALALLASLPWVAALARQDGASAAGAAALVLAVVSAALSQLRAPQPALRWTGKLFRLGEGDAAQEGRAEATLDVVAFMVLRFRPAAGGRPSWCTVAPGGAAARHRLRCALAQARDDRG